nr:hypothetical protein [Brucella abortus]
STPHVDREALEAEVRAMVRNCGKNAVRESAETVDADTVALAASFPPSTAKSSPRRTWVDAERIAGSQPEDRSLSIFIATAPMGRMRLR